MSLKEVKLKAAYYSDSDDILRDFYIPVLSESTLYKRIAGYFSSNSFAIAAKGISKLIENNGKIQLIANVIISEEDQNAIRQALDNIENDCILEIKNIEEGLKKDHIAMLGWLIKNGKLEIKIAVVKKGVEHQKIGVMYDINGNIISFSGSENETFYGWLKNDEQFHVFRSWIDGDDIHLQPDIERFDTLWENKSNQVKVYSISDAFKNGLIELAPKDADEFKKLSEKNIKQLLNSYKEMNAIGVRLREYQKMAIQCWMNRGRKGIFEMATATGKTYTALGCLKKVIEEEKRLLCVISTPFGHLNRQWYDAIKDFGLDYTTIIADSSNSDWKRELANGVCDIENQVFDVLVVITTHSTLSSQEFIKNIKMCKCKMFLIVDEVHGVGATKRRLGLIENYVMRLGLSATPKRYFDEDGTDIILKYFGESLNEKPTFEFSLHEAINTINPDDPDGKAYLAPYEYKPYFVELTNIELNEYIEKSKKIAKAYYLSKDKDEKNEYYQLLCILRQKIIVNAENKLIAFSQILKDMDDVSDCLIYCSDKQIDKVMKILDKMNIKKHRFTMVEGVAPKKEYGGLSERSFILNNFRKGVYQALVAIKVLDEGVDIPSAKNAIILANSGNPKEYIQRRGRVLRQAKNKSKAIIYDVTVIPKLNEKVPEEIASTERNIIRKEIKRLREFSISALNAIDCLEKIQQIEHKYLGE
ncbi:MAG: DEAD/DEAH box helicase family protein [Candidatus Aenigmarchaeota archaeon]|nr:DEAD/DEAH box helicase family protein [Candidatus Aenigmarchaeota archaeon]